MDRHELFKALVHSSPEPGSTTAARQRSAVISHVTGVSLVERVTEENIGEVLPIGLQMTNYSSLKTKTTKDIKPVEFNEPIEHPYPPGRPYHHSPAYYRHHRHAPWYRYRPWYGPPLVYPVPAPPLLYPPPPPPQVAVVPPPILGLPPEAVLYDPAVDLPLGWMLLSNGYRVPIEADLSRLSGVTVVRRREHIVPRRFDAPRSGDRPIKDALEGGGKDLSEPERVATSINDYEPYAALLQDKERIEADMKAVRRKFSELRAQYDKKGKSAQEQQA